MHRVTRSTGRAPSQRRRHAFLPVLMMVGFSLVLVISALPSITPSGSFRGQPTARSLIHAQLTSGTAPNYSPGELWGGGSPNEPCETCTANALLGHSGGQSLNGSQSISPVNGDFTTSSTLFNVKTTGDSLETTLSYSSELAQAQAASGATYAGYFSWGWESTINYSASNNAYGQVTLNEPNGSAVQFSPATSDGCGTGDYQDFQKYTTTDSYLPWCATSRLDAQLGSFGGVGYKLTEGNGAESGYSWTGQLAWSGTRADPQALSYTYNIAAGSYNCPSVGVASCLIESDGTIGGSGVRYSTVVVNTFGLIGEVIDPAGQVSTMTYDASGNLATITNSSTGAQTQYQYNTAQASPYNHQMGHVINPDGATTTLAYDTYGMAGTLVAPTGGSTVYTYGNHTCATTAGCVGPGVNQNTEVAYANGENDFDNYTAGVLLSDSFGSGTQTISQYNQLWQFAYAYPSTGYGWTTKVVTLPDGHTAAIATDAVGNVVSYTDPNGNVTQSMYNDTGGNNLDELCWTAAPGVSVPSTASCLNPPAGSTHFTYDVNGQKLSTTDQLGNTSYSGYYTNGELCWTAQATVGNGSPCTNGGTSPNGAPTGSMVFTYYQGNQILKTVAYNTTAAQTSQATYDTDSQTVYTLPPDGVSAGGWGANAYETRTYYSSYGLVQQTVAPFGRTTNYSYDSAGNVLIETDPAGVTLKAYDPDGRVCWSLRATSASSSPCGTAPPGSTVYGYVANTGTVSTQIDPNRNATTMDHADKQHPGDPTTITDAMGVAVSFKAYNVWGEACLTGPGNPWAGGGTATCPSSAAATPAGDTSSLFNDEGQLNTTTDPNGQTTTYAYANPAFPTDATSMTNPLGKVTSYVYDANGHQVSATDPAGNVITTAYDQNGRICYSAPVSTAAPCSAPPSGSGVTVNTWNPADERIQMVDNSGTASSATSTYAYDLNGNQTSTTDDNGRTVGYSYDVSGTVSCIAYPVKANPNCANAPSGTNSVVDRFYDGAGRLSQTTDWLGNAIQYQNYNQNSQLGKIVYPSSVNEALSYSYDNVGNLLSANYTGGSAGTNTWTYNADEQQASTSQLGTFVSPTDTYNNYKQVTAASNPTGSGSISDTYTNAPNSEMQADSATGKSAINLSYNGGAQLTSMTNPNLWAGSADTTYTYTADGQRCWSKASSTVIGGATCGSAPAGATSYQWNAKGQLCWSGQTTSSAPCSAPPAGVTTYSYDGNGLRMTKTPPSGSASQFSWDTVTGGSIPLMVDDGSKVYIYGVTLFGGTAPVEQITLANGSAKFIAAVPSGVQDVFSSTGTLLEQAAYSTYGSQSIEAGASTTPFGFQGSYTDGTGLVYLINRYYDPASYQFLSIDPKVGATMEPYAFVGGNPLNATDPLGLYAYTYRERLGSRKKVGSPTAVMNYFKSHVRAIFPFPISGRGSIRNESRLRLHPQQGLPGGVGDVQVEHVTPTSFTFKVTSTHYFDPPGSTITFSTTESHGEVFLQQHANAPRANPLFNIVAPPIAEVTWEEQAQNLSLARSGSYMCATSIWDKIAGTVAEC